MWDVGSCCVWASGRGWWQTAVAGCVSDCTPGNTPARSAHCIVQVIVNARKPDFFTNTMSLYEVVTEDGLMRPSYSLKRGGVYCGGSGVCCGLGLQAASCMLPSSCFLVPVYALHAMSFLLSSRPAAALVEKALGVAGDSILYVGDHICESSTAHSSTAIAIQ